MRPDAGSGAPLPALLKALQLPGAAERRALDLLPVPQLVARAWQARREPQALHAEA
jgi:hypothetical protein